MFAIELFRRYVKNSTVGISNSKKFSKLNYMAQKVKEILQGLSHGFVGDDSLYDKEDSSIYTLIKKDLLVDMLTEDAQKVCDVAEKALNSILTEIENMMLALVA